MLMMIVRAYDEADVEIQALNRTVNDLFACSCLVSTWLNKIAIGKLEIPDKVKRITVSVSEDLEGNPYEPAVKVYSKVFD